MKNQIKMMSPCFHNTRHAIHNMPNPFLTPPQNKKGRHTGHNDRRQAQENPFFSAKRNDESVPRRNCFSEVSNAAPPPPPPPPPPSFDELFPCLNSNAPPTAASIPAPSALNFKRVIQANVQQQEQRQQQERQHQERQHQERQQPERRSLNPFLSNTTNIRCKNDYNQRHPQYNEYDDEDECGEDTGVAYDSAYTKYYKD
jgi:hypothetical protein